MEADERRRRLEHELSEVQHRALLETCADNGIPAYAWPSVDFLRLWVETTAVRRRRRYLLRSFEISDTGATRKAAEYFGLRPAAVRKRIDRTVEAGVRYDRAA